MTYKKVNPIWRLALKPATTQTHISTHDASPTTCRFRAALSASQELHRFLSIPEDPQMDPETAFIDQNALLQASLAVQQEAPVSGSLNHSSSSINNDDDYDNCEEYDQAFESSQSADVWSFQYQQAKEIPPVLDLASDAASSDSENETDLDCGSFIYEAQTLDASVDSLSIPRLYLSDLPHWWGSEDQEHMLEVITHYDQLLGVTEERKKLIRAAKPFIGRIVRHQVPSEDGLQSIDEVSIYRYELLPFGQSMPLVRSHWVLTRWDEVNGLPITQSIVPNRVAHNRWLINARPTQVATIFCEPDAANPNSFICSADSDGRQRASASIGYFNACHSWSRFFPESTFQHGSLVDD